MIPCKPSNVIFLFLHSTIKNLIFFSGQHKALGKELCLLHYDTLFNDFKILPDLALSSLISSDHQDPQFKDGGIVVEQQFISEIIFIVNKNVWYILFHEIHDNGESEGPPHLYTNTSKHSIFTYLINHSISQWLSKSWYDITYMILLYSFFSKLSHP